MSMFKLFPDNIAAVCHVEAENGAVTQCIYLGPESLDRNIGQRVVIDVRDTPLEKSGLPQQVIAAINRHFGIVFSLPVERRGEYIMNLQPEAIEVQS